MTNSSLLYVGIDVHKDSVVFVTFRDDEQIPCSSVKKQNSDLIIMKYVNKLKEKGKLFCCYEAGPCGFHLHRLLTDMKVDCLVAAPGLIPRKPGERIKTDVRDAETLARNLRAGTLTSVYIPSQDDEAVRDYLRMRDDMKQEIKRFKQRIISFLARHGYRYTEGNYWTLAHRRWMKELDSLHPYQRESLDEYLITLSEFEEKLQRLDHRIERIADEEAYRDTVGKFLCFKGIGVHTALSLVVEIGDFRRFPTAAQFMGYLGLVPKEHSSGLKRVQGGLTKAGNSRLRKLLIESGWHYLSYQPSKRLRERREGHPVDCIAYADKAGRRLCKRFHHLLFRGKRSQKAVAAVARELAGFIWGMALERYS